MVIVETFLCGQITKTFTAKDLRRQGAKSIRQSRQAEAKYLHCKSSL
ncbi:MAG: hypothetical protein R8G34_13640 [Paracoccaceae bacterium]|nr:hypothetical protein [Paracoccaceae bacterium]